MSIKAVFLDVGGVFHLPRHELVLEALDRVGVSVDPDGLDRAHYAGMEALYPWPAGEGKIWMAYLDAYARAAGVPDDRLHAALTELEVTFRGPAIWSRIAPGSIEGLRALAATGIPIAIVSNADGTVEQRIAAEGICQVGPGPAVPVVTVIDSAVVGVAKPDPAIFRFALDATGTTPGEVVHVGDAMGADVMGAVAAGIRPLHLDPYGLCADDGHEHLARLGDLVELMSE